MPGLFMPENYVAEPPSPLEMNVASLVWGISLGFAMFTMAKGVRQGHGIVKRKGTTNLYIIMCLVEWTVSVMISILSWFFLFGLIAPSFALFFSFITLWVFQTQCIIQIIINRIALLVRDQSRIRRMQWATIALMGCVNISVYCIWIPAQLQVSETYIKVNFIWDRVGKVIFAIVDVALNVYFIRLVRSKLIANGFTKYNRLFYFNVGMICISLALDVILIGTMSIGAGVLYIQFHPLVYLIKLHIEMSLADLIAKTVRGEANSDPGVYYHSSTGGGRGTGPTGLHRHADPAGGVRMQTFVTGNRDGDNEYADVVVDAKGIQRTVETSVVHEHRKDEDNASRTSSTEELQKKFGIV